MGEKIFMGKKIMVVPWDTLISVSIHKDKEALVEKEFIDIEEIDEDEYFWRANKIIKDFQNED